MKNQITKYTKKFVSYIIFFSFTLITMLVSGYEQDTWQFWTMLIGCVGVYGVGVYDGS